MHRHDPASVTGFQGNPTDFCLQLGSTSSSGQNWKSGWMSRKCAIGKRDCPFFVEGAKSYLKSYLEDGMR